MNNQTQIFGDGNNLSIIIKDDYHGEILYQFKSPLIQSLRYDIDNDIDDIVPMNNNVMQFNPSSIVTVDIELKSTSDNMQTSIGRNLMMDLDMFKKLSVSQMFRMINKKLNQREKVK